MNNLRASLMMIAAMAAFAVEDALIKFLSATLSPGQIMVVVGIGGALIFAALAWRRRIAVFHRGFLDAAVVLRNLAEMFAAIGIVLSLVLVPLATVTAIMQATPIIVTLGAAVFLGERVGWRRWSAISVGLVGVGLILRPWDTTFDPAALLTVGAVVAIAARDIATRRVAAQVQSLQLSCWGFAMVVPGGVILMLAGTGTMVMPGPLQAVGLAACVLAGVLGYAALVAATRGGQLAVTMPFRYSRLVFATAIGMIFFGERPDAWTLAGAVLVVGAGLYTFWRELAVTRRASPARGAQL